MTNKNTYEILKTMDKLHKSNKRYELIALTELNAHLSKPTNWSYMLNLDQSMYISRSYKRINGIAEDAYQLKSAGYEYLKSHKTSSFSITIQVATFLITLITLLITLLAILL